MGTMHLKFNGIISLNDLGRKIELNITVLKYVGIHKLLNTERLDRLNDGVGRDRSVYIDRNVAEASWGKASGVLYAIRDHHAVSKLLPIDVSHKI
jgi:hypothetical protein